MSAQPALFSVSCSISVENWIRRTPSTAAVRPSHCPRCGVAANPAGGRVQVVGHGCRRRLLRTSFAPDGAVMDVVLLVRRYLCRACGAAIQVLPAEVVPRARYALTVMARALGMVALDGWTPAEARRVLGDGQERDWPAVRRWVRPLERLSGAGRGGSRARAERTAIRLLAHAAPWDHDGDAGRMVEMGARWIAGVPWRRVRSLPTGKDQVGVIAAPTTREAKARRHRTERVAANDARAGGRRNARGACRVAPCGSSRRRDAPRLRHERFRTPPNVGGGPWCP